MKKKLGAILIVMVLAVALAIPMAMPAMAHTEGNPYVTDLIADGGEPPGIVVGTVSVWNDGTNLYVTYEITEPDWVITETHLYVGKTDPQTLTSAPGQFPYSDEDATSVTDTMVTYVIPLADIDGYHMQLNKKGKETGKMVADDDAGVEPCNDIFIAAHAVVNMIEEGYTVTDCLVSGAGTDNVLYLDEDPLNLGYPLGYTGPYQTYPGTPIPSVLAFVHGSWPTLGVVGAQWISSSYYTENTDNNTRRLFTRSFTFPTNATNISGTLTMNCDNAEEVYLNGTFVGLDTYAPATKIYGMPLPGSGTAHGWSSVESWDVSSILNAGNNDLWTMTRNYAWSGGPTDNPGGLIYGLCYEYDIPDTVIATETAWGDGIGFPGANWATHFTYEVQGLVGDWLLSYVQLPPGGGTYDHNMTISSQSSDGSFSGTGNYPTGPMWTWNVTGTVTDSTVSMTITYDQTVAGTYPYIVSLTGTVGASGSSMSGTATDNRGHSYTWTATRVP